jgi:hypothetical protein
MYLVYILQVQLDGMVKEGLMHKEESQGVPAKTPGVSREFFAADPERHTLWFHFDFTMGKIPQILRNAYLSDAAKEEMYRLYTKDPEANDYRALAGRFKVRFFFFPFYVALFSFSFLLYLHALSLFPFFFAYFSVCCIWFLHASF